MSDDQWVLTDDPGDYVGFIEWSGATVPMMYHDSDHTITSVAIQTSKGLVKANVGDTVVKGEDGTLTVIPNHD